MPINYKVLGQINPSASGLTTLYTVPSGTQTICSTLTVCNLSTSTTFRIAIRPSGEAIANKHYFTYDSILGSNDSIMFTMGMSLNTSDVVSVYAASSGVSFSLFGSEIT
jgi:hypothetical protein